MGKRRPPTTSDGYRAVSAVLFLSLFAAQAGAITLSPVLPEVSRDLGVSTAAAGQLRTVAGLIAGVTALALGRLSTRFGLGRQLLAGSTLLALGSLLSAAAPGIGLLALAQAPVGAGIGILTTASALAAGEWVPRQQQPAVLSRALTGQPWAWIVGMPLLGFAGEASWRYAWLSFPLAAAALAAAAVGGRRDAPPVEAPPAHLREALAVAEVRRWLTAEMLANTAWAGTLVYAGALFFDSYGTSAAATGVLLAIGAGASVSGNVVLRRLAGGEPRRCLVGLALALAVVTTTFDAFRPSLAASTALFAVAAFAAAGRTLLSGAFGLSLPPAVRPAAMSMRAASLQFGYFTGSLAAGAALALGGDAACGATTGALFAAAALALMRRRASAEQDGREPTAYPGRALGNAA